MEFDLKTAAEELLGRTPGQLDNHERASRNVWNMKSGVRGRILRDVQASLRRAGDQYSHSNLVLLLEEANICLLTRGNKHSGMVAECALGSARQISSFSRLPNKQIINIERLLKPASTLSHYATVGSMVCPQWAHLTKDREDLWSRDLASRLPNREPQVSNCMARIFVYRLSHCQLKCYLLIRVWPIWVLLCWNTEKSQNGTIHGYKLLRNY
jgi:hypothetical protein